METNSFHMPFGEMTITLDDVSSLLHIPIRGKLHLLLSNVLIMCFICYMVYLLWCRDFILIWTHRLRWWHQLVGGAFRSFLC